MESNILIISCIAFLDFFIEHLIGRKMALWKYFKWEVKTPLPSPTDSASKYVSSGIYLLLIRGFNNSIIFDDNHNKLNYHSHCQVLFGSGVSSMSGHKSMFVNVILSLKSLMSTQINHTCCHYVLSTCGKNFLGCP